MRDLNYCRLSYRDVKVQLTAEAFVNRELFLKVKEHFISVLSFNG